MSTSITAKELTHNEPFAVVSAAVMCSPQNEVPVYREIGFAYNPKLQVPKLSNRMNVWRFKNPFTFRQLSHKQKKRENNARRYVHGINYTTEDTERHLCMEQHTTSWTLKKCWEDYGSLTPDKQLIVLYGQEDVGKLLNVLGIPCASIATTYDVDETFDPYSRYLSETYTCQFLHGYGCPCQATLAERWALFVYDFLESREKPSSPVDWKDTVNQEDENDSL